ncbi:MAG: chromosome segregation protein SMC [Nitrospirota bacterium]
MRIERIELIGFKSFYDKTVFNFHSGITAVVGPNGCGKSNVVDSFKWVLGEQSAKSLRGDSMEDVIFVGSATKKPKGMAEVTLVISGVNNGNSPEGGEITVTRRLYRSGESEYLMNKTPCRLKDIKNVFLDTGLELKTYSILEQGRIDAILNSKPHERRFLIEEVAGVMKYNVRKAEALQKLESSHLNLQRLQDIISEVKRQINSIERYAKRAEKYKQLFDEIKNIEIKIAVRDAASLGKELKDITGLENILKLKETELSTNIHSSDVLIEEKKLSCTEKEKNLEEIQRKLNSAEREFIEEEGRISLLKSDCKNLKDRLERLFVRDSELAGAKENITVQIKDAERKNNEMEVELSNIEKVLSSKKEVFSAIEGEIADLEQKLETARKRTFDKAEEISVLKNEINNLSLMRESLERKEKKDHEDISLIRDDIAFLASSIKEAEDEYNRLDSGLKEKYNSRESSLDDINKKKEKLTEQEQNLYREREDFAAMTSRAESLKEMDAGRKTAVNNKIKILCQVADIFEPLPEYETAIEATLGEKLNVSVVDDNQEIRKALEFIKEQKVNRSGFISVNASSALSRIVGTASSRIVGTEGILGKAIDFVKVKEGFNNIAVILLNDVIVVNDLSTAFELWRKSFDTPSSNYGLRYFVTLDGEVLEPSGIVFGGTEKSILKVKREIRELGKNIENKKAYILSTEAEVSSLKNDIASIEEGLASLNNEISRMEKSHHELQVKIANLKEEDSRQQKKIEYFTSELDGAAKEKDNLQQVLDKRTENCNALESEKRSIEEEFGKFQAELGEKKTVLETLRSELTETMLSRTAVKGENDALLREYERLNSELQDIDKKKEEMAQERLQFETDIEHKNNEIAKKEDSLKSVVITISELQGELSKVKEILEAKMAELSLIEKRQKTNMEELTSVRKDIAHAEIKKTELTLNIAHLKEDFRKTYSIDLDSIAHEQNPPEPLLPDEEEKLHDLKEKLQSIGPVNLGTLEELEELKTRYDFLTKQQDDLLQSITSLQETISKINSTTKKKLSEAFEALNEKFKEVFAMLFGRGRAELILTEESILDAGIDIVAQPPGKKLQNLMLLSGGEKALTAISLLFAGFMIKPTPLCLLDEVDAPLDESNTDRFTSLLTGLAKNIQFITITHNRRTMEVADYIYGITMEEPGVSKVVSMHMAEMV